MDDVVKNWIEMSYIYRENDESVKKLINPCINSKITETAEAEFPCKRFRGSLLSV